MLSFQTALPWLSKPRGLLPGPGGTQRAPRDVVACYCEEHPGTVALGRVLYHTTAFDGVRTAEMLECCDALVLLDRDGSVLTRVERDRIRSVECASASPLGCRERNPLQSEQHLFVSFDDEQGQRTELEISFGALDDVGPVHQMCDHLRAFVTPAQA